MNFNAKGIKLKRLLFVQIGNWKRWYWIRLRVYAKESITIQSQGLYYY